uniref:Uncharacterized protein n=1 Tax=Arundo donax TaxID=35708 RepID=A0A0A9GZ98_ARUDO
MDRWSLPPATAAAAAAPAPLSPATCLVHALASGCSRWQRARDEQGSESGEGKRGDRKGCGSGVRAGCARGDFTVAKGTRQPLDRLSSGPE